MHGLNIYFSAKHMPHIVSLKLAAISIVSPELAHF
jgi:hypothetical protein